LFSFIFSVISQSAVLRYMYVSYLNVGVVYWLPRLLFFFLLHKCCPRRKWVICEIRRKLWEKTYRIESNHMWQGSSASGSRSTGNGELFGWCTERNNVLCCTLL